MALSASAGSAQETERGLISPSAEQPVRAEPGASFSLVVNSATALTPPPGIQEPRAHRAFGVLACANGLSFGAPEHLCFSLAVEDLRPLASHSLAYRVDVSVPHWMAPGVYQLKVRFPGGTQSVPAGLRVGGAEPPACEYSREGPSADGAVLVSASCPRTLRVHLGGTGGLAGADSARGYPLPTERGELGDGVVLLMELEPGRPLRLGPAAREVKGERLAIEVTPARERTESVMLEVRQVPQGAQVFWRLTPWKSALGPKAQARFQGTSRAGLVSAALVGPGGRLRRGQVDLTKMAPASGKNPLGCRVEHGSGAGSVAGLLFLALSRKLGPRRRSRGLPRRSHGE
ncbi:MAG: hypothetical protein QM778_19280 [Myxococcales bacterium]